MIIHIEEKAMTEQLFEKALGIETPWHVKAVRFDAVAGELTIEIDFARGSAMVGASAWIHLTDGSICVSPGE